MAKESSNGKGHSPFSPPKGSVGINPLRIPVGHLLFRVHRQQFAGDCFNNTLQGNARFSPMIGVIFIFLLMALGRIEGVMLAGYTSIGRS
ncbi:hypothetical protein [Pseudomonas graminis]